METVNRYRLVYHYFKGGEKLFSVDYQDGRHRDRFMLTEIDALTSRCADEKQLAQVLKVVSDDYNNGYFVIEYNSQGSLKTMELVFNDMPLLGQIAFNNCGKSRISKEDASKYARVFLKEINEDADFLKFVLSRRYINSYFHSALNYYLRLKNSDEKEAQNTLWEAKANLLKEFSRYKTIRGIEIGRRNYKLFKQKKEVPSDSRQLTVLQRAKIEYELNHPKKVDKPKLQRKKVVDGQMALFDADNYSNTNKRTKK